MNANSRTGSSVEPANIVDGLFAIADAIRGLSASIDDYSKKADARGEKNTSAIRSISHGGVDGATGLEMLSMAMIGPGASGHDSVSGAIRSGLGDIAEAIAEAGRPS